jgi:hypothetical protein
MFTIIYLIMIKIIMRGENFVAHRCTAEHRLRITAVGERCTRKGTAVKTYIRTANAYRFCVV